MEHWNRTSDIVLFSVGSASGGETTIPFANWHGLEMYIRLYDQMSPLANPGPQKFAQLS